jgi:hypothetical protein
MHFDFDFRSSDCSTLDSLQSQWQTPAADAAAAACAHAVHSSGACLHLLDALVDVFDVDGQQQVGEAILQVARGAVKRQGRQQHCKHCCWQLLATTAATAAVSFATWQPMSALAAQAEKSS